MSSGNRKAAILLMVAWQQTVVAVAADLQAPETGAQERKRPLDSEALGRPLLSEKQRSEERQRLAREIRRRRDQANRRDRQSWRQIAQRDQWEAFRDQRIKQLRSSLATFPKVLPPQVVTTGSVPGDGFQIQKILYRSRPRVWVPAHLYRPQKARSSMPVMLIAHSHHYHKMQSELQDMGMTWARAGCLVLVIDQFGYGERRTHPFHSAADYQQPFRVSRQDYYHRYDSGVQLQLLGDSLMGWMTWDLSRGLDLLLAEPGADPARTMILGAVAGGGDPAAVTAALDQRLAACVPFNFGGPQPETRYPLPADAEQSFNYVAGSYWDSTRGLARSAKEGFLHWVIVASLAPRHLIHAHEFSWDQAHDPVWKRYQRIFGHFYGQADHLDFAHGKGLLRGPAKEASHCTNIGVFHRRRIHAAFQKWFQISADEYRQRVHSKQLVCWTAAMRKKLPADTALQAIGREADLRLKQARQQLTSLAAAERRQKLQGWWRDRLGMVTPDPHAKLLEHADGKLQLSGAEEYGYERFLLDLGRDGRQPCLLIRPQTTTARPPVVVAIAQAGKVAFLKHRAAEMRGLLKAGVAVCLVNLPGTGEVSWGNDRGRSSSATGYSTNLMMFGETILALRLRAARALIKHLRTQPRIDGKRIAVWGDSFAKPLPQSATHKVPRGVSGRPQNLEPLGGLLALLIGLYEPVDSLYIRGGLTSFRSQLNHYQISIPHDALVPGAIQIGDLEGLLLGQSQPIRCEQMVDGMNRPLTLAEVRSRWPSASSRPQLSLGPLSSVSAWVFGD